MQNNDSYRKTLGTRSDAVREIEDDDDDDELESSFLESDNGEDDEEDSSSEFSSESIDLWRSNKRNLVPFFYFSTAALDNKEHKARQIGKKFCMTFRMVNECKVVRQIMTAHGFKESHPGDFDFNLMWTGKHLKAEVVRNFYKHQRINHFPRTYELTRKDRLYKNIQKMQETKGFRNFDIVPTTFLIPQEYSSFSSYFCREGGIWIVKPVALSRGRGIFLVSHPDQVPTDESFVVSRYITNPLLIDGYKFDIRLYVVVTSFDPLVIYLYEEGLTRFATVKFDKTSRHIGNHFMHLTNYSVNKRSLSFIQNSDPDIEDQGSKWTLGALLRRLRSQGRDVVSLMMKIEDVIVKTIVSAEPQISAACRMYVPYKENCFEIFGFDIIVDENLKPWVLEVNLSPSLACDSPLDQKVKSHMLCDMFNLVGLPCSDEVLNQVSTKTKTSTTSNNSSAKPQAASNGTGITQRPHSGIKILRSSRIRPSSAAVSSNGSCSNSPLSTEERQSIRRIREESLRAGGFVRLFPTEDSWELYGSFFDSHASFNGIVHDNLFGDRNKQRNDSSLSYSMLILRQNTLQQHSNAIASAISSLQRAASVTGSGSAAVAYHRAKRYERSLPRPGHKIKSPPRHRSREPAKQNSNQNRASNNTKDNRQSAISANNSAGEAQHVKNVRHATTATMLQTSATESQKEGMQQQVNHATHVQVSMQEKSPVDYEPVQVQPNSQQQVANLVPNLISDIENGYSLSVAQARSAFTRYLELVRSRLLTPLSASAPLTTQEVADAEAQNLDLVVRFMRRAAVNLSETVKVTPPSKRLGLEDQRIFVANQMTDFLRVYKKDTFLLPIDENSERNNTCGLIDANKLSEYLALVSEGELEKFLTHYTKVKKSASIFLGSPLSAANPGSSKSSRSSTATVVVGNHRQSTTISETAQQQYIKRTESYTSHIWSTSGEGAEGAPEYSNEDEMLSHADLNLPEGIVIRSEHHGSVHHRPPVPISRSVTSIGNSRPVSASSNSSSRQLNSSLAAAVAVYSAPVRPPLAPPYPAHTSSGGTSHGKGNATPTAFSSVTTTKPPGDTPALASSAYLRWSSSTKGMLATSCSDAILNAALQRIALKYSSPSASGSHRSQNADTRRLNHSGSLTSLANGAPPVAFSIEQSGNSRVSTVAPSVNAGSISQAALQSVKTRPQSASNSASGRPPLPESVVHIQHPSHRRPRNPQATLIE